jgi:hypothetical protein
MPNPFRREQDAFRMLLAFVAGAALVIAVTLASGEAVYGIVVGVALIGFWSGKLWADFRHWQAEARREETRPTP